MIILALALAGVGLIGLGGALYVQARHDMKTWYDPDGEE